MSTLVSVNHKHPSSSVNNLVLDASGNVAGEAGPIGAYVPPPEPIVPVRVPSPDTTGAVVL